MDGSLRRPEVSICRNILCFPGVWFLLIEASWFLQVETSWDSDSDGRRQHRADGRADRAADVERGGRPGVRDLQLFRDLPEELPRGPAHHGDARGADGVALRDEAPGRVDPALAVGPRLAVHPVRRALAGRRLADHL